MLRNKEAPHNITIINVSSHTRKQILIQEEPEESEFKVIILGSIIPLLIIAAYCYLNTI